MPMPLKIPGGRLKQPLCSSRLKHLKILTAAHVIANPTNMFLTMVKFKYFF
jgi:hypothetical protein